MSDPYEARRPAEADADNVSGRDDVVGVLRTMINDFRKNPDEWENATVDAYLDGLAASIEDLDQLYADRGELPPDQPSWQLVAKLLVMASGYE